MNNLDELRQYYEKHKQETQEFLKKCADSGRSDDAKELFKFLCCNLLASQAKWETVERAVDHLDDTNRLFDGDPASIQEGLKNSGYGSPNNKEKARWLHKARQRFCDDGCEIGIVDFVHMLGIQCGKDPIRWRNLLADPSRDNHILGLGMKEASHFLRGLGFSHNQLAILDSVVLGQLECFGVVEIEKKPGRKKREGLTKKTYLAIEGKVKDWADNVVSIPLDGLDWLLWKLGRGNGHAC